MAGPGGQAWGGGHLRGSPSPATQPSAGLDEACVASASPTRRREAQGTALPVVSFSAGGRRGAWAGPAWAGLQAGVGEAAHPPPARGTPGRRGPGTHSGKGHVLHSPQL